MAHITAGIACSHVPAIGAAIDLGKTADAYLLRRELLKTYPDLADNDKLR